MADVSGLNSNTLFNPMLQQAMNAPPVPQQASMIVPGQSGGAPANAAPAMGNNNDVKAAFQNSMKEGTELTMMSMQANNLQTANSMMMTQNAHENNARITAVDTLGKLMNKGFNKANAAVQSQ
jgi:hypothetical protein